MTLLLEIARCPEAAYCFNQPMADHPCRKIVQVQEAGSLAELQVPEPWSGDLEHAPILFLSSNPSISTAELYPRWNWPDEEITDYFNHRFGGGRRQWIRDGKKSLRPDGSYGRATAFWAAVRKRAMELLQREVRPGVDYALTEIAHCKSKSEIGVAEAKKRCVPRYLRRVLALSAAKVIVVLGKPARQAVQEEFGIPDGAVVYGPEGLCGRERMLAFLPHTNYRGARTFAACLPAGKLEILRLFLS